MKKIDCWEFPIGKLFQRILILSKQDSLGVVQISVCNSSYHWSKNWFLKIQLSCTFIVVVKCWWFNSLHNFYFFPMISEIKKKKPGLLLFPLQFQILTQLTEILTHPGISGFQHVSIKNISWTFLFLWLIYNIFSKTIF